HTNDSVLEKERRKIFVKNLPSLFLKGKKNVLSSESTLFFKNILDEHYQMLTTFEDIDFYLLKGMTPGEPGHASLKTNQTVS
ncbi:MAG: hypothetical protein JW774_00630, partial [Candidatus Aureabacteria bacterium]|nr:hypothetical protein [Candidatus Auribacterota bacterium]